MLAAGDATLTPRSSYRETVVPVLKKKKKKKKMLCACSEFLGHEFRTTTTHRNMLGKSRTEEDGTRKGEKKNMVM